MSLKFHRAEARSGSSFSAFSNAEIAVSVFPDSFRMTPSLLKDPGVRVSPAVRLDEGPPSPI